MKRRAAALLLCLLLLLSLPASPVQAKEYVNFTAVGSYVLPLSDSTMPFWNGGFVYIPSSIFTGTVRETLNISQLLNSSQGRLVLYSAGRSLTYTLSDNWALDNDGNAYYPGAIQRNGTVFVPVSTVSKYFDLSYSVIEVERGNLIWLRQPGYSASDKLFADAAQYSMNAVYNEYIQAKEAAQAESGSADASSDVQDPPVKLEGKRIALCLKGGSDAAVMVDTLRSYDAGAAFFFTPEEMAEQGEQLRRMAAAGQSIGILVDVGDPEQTVEEQLEAGNAALFQATCGKTRLAFLPNGSPQAVQNAEGLGFHCLVPEEDGNGRPLRNASGAQALAQRLAARQGDVSVWLDAGTTAVGLRALLSAVKEVGGNCVAYNETGLP